MGRHAGGWKLEWRGPTGRRVATGEGVAYVRFTHAKRQQLISTGKRDAGAAAIEAARIYSRVIAGGAVRPASTRALVAVELDVLFVRWISSLEGTLDVETLRTYEVTYCGKHWITHYATIEDMCSEVARERYRAARLKAATSDTVKKETWVQDKFLRWCAMHKVIGAVPPPLVWESTTTGTRTGKQRKYARELTLEQVEAFLAALPPWREVGKRAIEKKPFPVRDRFVFAYETGLRPATVSALRWEDWNDAAATLRIRDEADKIRFGRVVPVSARAAAAIRGVRSGSSARGRSTEPGARIFGQHSSLKTIAKAAAAVGLDGVAPYDLRHARATHLADAGAALTGIGFLVGHRQTTTTNRYLHGGETAAIAALTAGGDSRSESETDLEPGDEKQGDRRGLNPRHLEPQGTSTQADSTGSVEADADGDPPKPAETDGIQVTHLESPRGRKAGAASVFIGVPLQLLEGIRYAHAAVYGGRP